MLSTVIRSDKLFAQMFYWARWAISGAPSTATTHLAPNLAAIIESKPEPAPISSTPLLPGIIADFSNS